MQRWREDLFAPARGFENIAYSRQKIMLPQDPGTMSPVSRAANDCAYQKLRSAEKSRVLRFAAIVSPAWIRPCVRSSRLLPADCAAGWRWN